MNNERGENDDRIAEVDRDRVDGLHPRRGSAGKAERARQPVRIEEAAVAVAVGLRAEFGRKVLGSPRQSLEPGARGPWQPRDSSAACSTAPCGS